MHAVNRESRMISHNKSQTFS